MGDKIMDNKLHNHRAFTAWEKSANELEQRVAICITVGNKKESGMEAVQMYTILPPEFAIQLLDELVTSLRSGDGHKPIGGGNLNHPSN